MVSKPNLTLRVKESATRRYQISLLLCCLFYSYSLTLIDAMDTLVVMGNHSEFRRIAQLLIDKGESFFDTDINASVFETNIRSKGIYYDLTFIMFLFLIKEEF